MSTTTNNLRDILTAKRAKAKAAEPKPLAGKAPPHDLAAEAAVLTACITRTSIDGPENIDRVIALLGTNGDAFYGKLNATIYETIVELHQAQRGVDMVTLPSRLCELDRYQQDVEEHLMTLTSTLPAIGSKMLTHHATIIAKKAKLRRWIYAAQESAAFAYGDVLDVDAFVRERTAALEEISQQAIAVKPTSTLVEAAGVLNAEIEEQILAGSLGVAPGLPTGIPKLDELTGGLHNTEVVMLSGPKKGFKSSAMISIAMHVAGIRERYVIDGLEQTRGCGVAIFELEMTPQKIAFTAACQRGRVERSRFRKGLQKRADLEALLLGQREFAKLPIVIDPRTDTSIVNLRARIREARFRCMVEFKCPLRFIAIDTLQLFALNPAHRPGDEQSLVDAAMALIRKVSLDPENVRTAFMVTSQVNADGDMRGSRAIEMHCNEWWSLEVRDNDGPFALPSKRIAQFTVKMGRDVERTGESAATWLFPSCGRFGDDE